ncbi:uncharacterized protein [Watersipora subatra]|uniref:uncharacterized protein n=1 Tax=Watersipora subatra TaxID=2589382 RepID=UPI00355B24F7
MGDTTISSLEETADDPENDTMRRSRSNSLLAASSESTRLCLDVEDEKLKRILANDHRQCQVCNGYYGSNHSQPVCWTCHLFLYAAPDLDQEESFLTKPSTPERPPVSVEPVPLVESDDSGTEQPDLPLESATDEDAAEASVGAETTDALLNIYASLECCSLARNDPQMLDALMSANPTSSPLMPWRADQPPSHSVSYILYLKSLELKKRVCELTVYNPNNGAHLGSLVENLPPEVLLQIFQYLDDFGFWAVKNVCSKWAALIDSEVPDNVWEQFVKNRWPLFVPRYIVNSWSDVYSLLINSSSCHHCLPSMVLLNSPPICEAAWKHRRLASELRSLQKEPPEGIQAVPLDRDCRFFQALIVGPKGSPYEGGRFYLYLQIPKSYPLIPPLVRFITKVLHPNVSLHGDIGLDSINHNWSLALTLSKLLLSIQSLLTDPYIKVCMEPAVGKLYVENRNLFNQAAREWTWRYAMAEVQQVYFGHVGFENGFQPFAARSI